MTERSEVYCVLIKTGVEWPPVDTQPETARGNNAPRNCTVDIIPPTCRKSTEQPQIIADNVTRFPCDAARFDAACVGCGF